MNKKNIKYYRLPNNKRPFIDWLEGLKDPVVRAQIKRRLDCVSIGNFGDHKSISNGISELRLSFGAGYRIYYAEDNETIVLLLCGGDKNSQTKDIKQAKKYWEDYLEKKRCVT